MATTGFWPIRSNLSGLIKYTENPEKTAIMNADERESLQAVLEYDMNDIKTEEGLYVTGINCLPETAYERMMATKRQFGKTGGVLAYHAYQSFPSGEVTTEQCHRIGVETAKRMWGERFEVTVSTHRNTDNLHNHYCINSLSFVDGKKFLNKIAEHKRFRAISDQVCREWKLSTLDNAKFYSGASKKAYWKNKTLGEMEKEIMRQDFLEAANHSEYEWQFCKYLSDLGYYINRDWQYKHISVTPPGWSKTVRVDSIVPELTSEGLSEIVQDNYYRYRYEYKPYPKFNRYPLERYEYKLRWQLNRHNDIKDFIDLVFKFLYMIVGLDGNRDKPERPVILSPKLRQEVPLLNEHQRIIRFVSKRHIQTPQDIRDAQNDCQRKLDNLIEIRRVTYNRIRRPKPTDTPDELRRNRDALTKEIAAAREELKTAGKVMDILTRLEDEVKEELRLERGEQTLPEPPTADSISRSYYTEDEPKGDEYPFEEPRQKENRSRSSWDR